MKKVCAKFLVFVMVFSMLRTGSSSEVLAKTKKPTITKKISVNVGKTKKVKITSKQKIKKTTWSLTKKGKKIVKLSKRKKNNVTVKGLKKGTATVTAKVKVGKKTYKLKSKITVKKKTNAMELIQKATPTPVITQEPMPTFVPTQEPIQPTEEPSQIPLDEIMTEDGKLKKDVECLNAILDKQEELGVDVTELRNFNNQNIYTWDNNGNVTSIYWKKRGLKGDISFENPNGFQELTQLTCSGGPYSWDANHEVTSVSVSGCAVLQTLDCSYNGLSSLNVEGCTNLLSLSCNSNSIETLDVSDCSELGYLDCQSTKISELNLDNCKKLYTLWCRSTQLENLDVTKCEKLSVLHCSITPIKELDVSKCPELSDGTLWEVHTAL